MCLFSMFSSVIFVGSSRRFIYSFLQLLLVFIFYVTFFLNLQVFKRVGKVRNVTIARKKDKDHPG